MAESIRVELGLWEIECCVSPPAIGDVVNFWLSFVQGSEPEEDYLLTVTHHGPHGIRVEGHSIVAEWSSAPDRPPPTGISMLRGSFGATAHGPGPAEVGQTVGRVRRVWTVSREFAPDPVRDRYWLPQPGTTELVEVSQAPARVERHGPGGRQLTSVLLDLDVLPHSRLPR